MLTKIVQFFDRFHERAANWSRCCILTPATVLIGLCFRKHDVANRGFKDTDVPLGSHTCDSDTVLMTVGLWWFFSALSEVFAIWNHPTSYYFLSVPTICIMLIGFWFMCAGWSDVIECDHRDVRPYEGSRFISESWMFIIALFSFPVTILTLIVLAIVAVFSTTITNRIEEKHHEMGLGDHTGFIISMIMMVMLVIFGLLTYGYILKCRAHSVVGMWVYMYLLFSVALAPYAARYSIGKLAKIDFSDDTL